MQLAKKLRPSELPERIYADKEIFKEARYE